MDIKNNVKHVRTEAMTRVVDVIIYNSMSWRDQNYNEDLIKTTLLQEMNNAKNTNNNT